MSNSNSTRDDDDINNNLAEGEVKEKLRECFKVYNDRKKKLSLRFQPGGIISISLENSHLY